MKHSLTGGSNAHIWWYCPGSVYLNKVVPVVETDAMRKGTELHEEAADVLRDGGNAPSKIVRDYVALIQDIPIRHVEQRAEWGDNNAAFGTVDVYWYDQERLHVCDFKTGATPVAVEKNEQLLTYAYWLTPFYDIEEKPVLHIAQPKVSKTLQTWEPTDEEWESAKKQIDWALKSVYEGPVELVTGTHCSKCRAKDFCPKKKAERDAAVEGW